MGDIIKEHLLELYKKESRLDGRAFDEFRKVEIEYGISSKSAEGSARVKIGKTEVVAGVKLEIGKPYPDSPEEGTIMVNVELLPLSNPDFESGPPGIDAIEVARVVDKVIREGHCLDFKKLCIKSGEQMLIVLIDVYPINDAGNLFDAAALAALAAIKDARLPKIEGDKMNYKERTDKKLPIKAWPMSCTVLKIGDRLVVDPLYEEEKMADARLTVGIVEDGDLCALQKGGDEGLMPEDIEKMVEIAIKKTKELRKVFEK